MRKVRAALDEHAPASPHRPRQVQVPKLAPHDSERKFERFIRAIRQTSTLADARRFRSEISTQLRKDSAVEGQDQLYLRRLETARKILDQRVQELSAGGTVRAKVAARERPKHKRTRSKFENATLRDVLSDASGLSCFMEYMDRLNLMRLVQFWINVQEGFRNPLEQDTDEPLEHLGSGPGWTDSDRADLAQIHEAYLTKPEVLKVYPQAREAVREFLKAGRTATPQQYFNARRALLKAQTAVYEEMQDPHFRRFKGSELYYKWLDMDEAANGASKTNPPDIGPEMFDRPASPATIRMARTQSGTRYPMHAPDLRRAIASSSDLKSQNKLGEIDTPARRSLDDSAPRKPLFDDEYDTDPLANSMASITSDPEVNPSGANDRRVVDAMQAALNDIMGDVPEGSLFHDPMQTSQDNDSLRGSFDLPRSSTPNPMVMRKSEKELPSIASLGLVGEPKTRGVFDDDLFGDDAEKFLEDELEDSPTEKEADEDEIHEAAPGDLGLAEAIDKLTAEIERLVNQESIVDSLMSKAELTNNAAELRILKKSKSSLQREITRKELQRQQYIVQESDNSLYGRATVYITTVKVGTEQDGKEYAICKASTYLTMAMADTKL